MKVVSRKWQEQQIRYVSCLMDLRFISTKTSRFYRRICEQQRRSFINKEMS